MHKATVERRPTGRNAASMKYDILTALGAHACAGDKHRQRLVLRLLTLIVARYNWVTDELTVGQREMAALWSIDERSVKRDIAKLRDCGWLVQKRPAARGRVAVHGLDLPRILGDTSEDWARVGSDFLARMSGPQPAEPVAGNVIAFPTPPTDAGLWPRMQTHLHREDPNLFGAWFAVLRGEPADRVLYLFAPSTFHADYVRTNLMTRLERAARTCDPGIERVEVLCQ